jgi:hypothetical protein
MTSTVEAGSDRKAVLSGRCGWLVAAWFDELAPDIAWTIDWWHPAKLR